MRPCGYFETATVGRWGRGARKSVTGRYVDVVATMESEARSPRGHVGFPEQQWPTGEGGGEGGSERALPQLLCVYVRNDGERESSASAVELVLSSYIGFFFLREVTLTATAVKTKTKKQTISRHSYESYEHTDTPF